MNKIGSKIIWLLIILFAIAAIIRIAGRIYPGIKPSFDSGSTRKFVEDFPKTSEEVVLKEAALFIEAGFGIGVYAEGLGRPRVIVFDEEGRMIVTDTRGGNVYQVVDGDGDGFAETNTVLFENLNNPHGLLWYEGDLFIATTDAVERYSYDHITGTVGKRTRVLDLPNPRGARHTTRSIVLGSDDRVYVSIGSTCDTCIERDNRIGTIISVNPDGTDEKIFATGLRNAVYFSFHPLSNELYATEMGRDFLGDILPPDEINIVEEGRGYGWPFCYGDRVYDTIFAGVNNCALSEGSFIDLPAHVAPLGIAFAPDSWGDTYEYDLIVAYHGSWNSSVPVGYKVVRFDYVDGEYEKIGSDFITGFLKNGDAVGRPAGLTFDREGNLYITDDKAGVIYKVVKDP